MDISRNEVIIQRYDRISLLYDWMDKMIKDEWRNSLLANVRGDILEVGIGTGINLKYYPKDINSLTGVDFSEGMLNLARKKKKKLQVDFKVNLMNADIQVLPFPDNTFDSIVSTCVFCSVPDPVKGLKELKRVCKPEGEIFMIEHMRSSNPLAGVLMDALNPLTVRLWGANINRDTLHNIDQSGLVIVDNIPLMGTVVRKLTLGPNN
ncbi:class I SAM-dependent methyltransferase (plasmid) [Cytobacillus firmus]|uniref:Class I SAM-dependent methyltransferase n=3 Tax=Cytobacillus TaxID=2675230 RepID=A0AA46SMM8_CYTFI|nr:MULTISPECIES: class I SAM-dependent methyltransferase [Cytobacillus]AND43018.1 methyltransferase type 11 [Cytobacillus oceanisediminis 2691]EWG09265.1 methyltransferase type 11 protein [Cytobacillus firmus DS1]MCM3244604.1 class I SAM-dependent methyltransferase [Cytobacillus oceanisediminis]USK41809.1 class I SAM-dependent methyltransferase [Cytobacillus firmus]USK47536.1 class I SAM-dependent methyltransferase [Cytobacillus oceanisediminis]